MKMYEVGGCIRDEILGVPSKDIDFSVVLDPGDVDGDAWHFNPGQGQAAESHYDYMVRMLEQMGVKIIRDKEDVPVGAEFLTARGIAPKNFPTHPGRALDFVLARKEEGYTDGRRPDKVEPGTLMDDLKRRDFTMNAIAKDADGSYIDPFNGREDIYARTIRAVGDPLERLDEDALRAVRAIRFSVTKGFGIDKSLREALFDPSVVAAVEYRISDDRIAAELSKMFRFDTMKSLRILNHFSDLTEAMFAGSVSLDATMKTKGRGK